MADGPCSHFIKGYEMEIRPKNYLSKASSKGKEFNKPEKTQSSKTHLTKNGQIYKNNYLSTDLTDQSRTKRKIHA